MSKKPALLPIGTVRTIDGGIWYPAEKIEEHDIDSDVMYSGLLVLDLMQRIRRQEREKALHLHREITQTRHETGNLINNIDNWLNRIGDVALTAGKGEVLRTYLKTKNAHDKLIGRLHSLNRVIIEQTQRGLMRFEENDRSLAEFNTAVETFAFLVDLVEQNKDDGSQLLAWITEHGSDSTQQLIGDLRVSIDHGGRPEGTGDPILDALYRRALPFYKIHRNQWSKIRDALWKSIEYRRAGESRDSDEQIIYTEWRRLSPKQRREQLRTAFGSRTRE